MSIYATVIGAIAGICLGYALLFAFVGLRRHQDKRLNLFFALFAFGYAGTLLLGIVYRSQRQQRLPLYLALGRAIPVAGICRSELVRGRIHAGAQSRLSLGNHGLLSPSSWRRP